MPTLEWLGKDKVVNHHLDVPYRVLEHRYTYMGNGANGAEISDGNKIIRGDNLEALKALLPQYEGRIKCVYIDPPYNTGNEGWVYNDNVNDPKIKKWLGEVVGKEGEDLSRHDKWLCMMYPRLRLLQRLLANDGVIFISIDDNEITLLRMIMDELFGIDNFISQMVCEGAFKNDARQIGVNHEYILVYAKKRSVLPREWKIPKDGVDSVFKEVKRLKNIYKDDFEAASVDLAGWFRANKAKPCFNNRRFRYIDARGAYKEDDPTAPGGRKYELIDPISGNVIPLRPNRGWAFDQKTFNNMVAEGRISFVSPTSIMVRRYLHETDSATPQSVFYLPTRSGSERLDKLLGKNVFDFPKDENMIIRLLQMSTDPDSIILDSFAGSGTTAHAVLNLNKQDGGKRKFILVEMMDYAESITAERVRRVIDGYADVSGTGGEFSFYDLGEPLLLENKYINEAVPVEKIREYVWFMETGQPLPQADESEPYLLGSHNRTAYYFCYEKDHLSTLDHALLQRITTKADAYIIYADINILSDAELERHHLIFKKIPRDMAKL